MSNDQMICLLIIYNIEGEKVHLSPSSSEFDFPP